MPRTDSSRLLRWALRACMALPLLMLAANLLAWLRWGTDLPYFDDWWAYDMRNALSLSPARLFQAVNNTISPVGLALDALAQRWLGGNPLPYQTLSMLGVLGGLLWMQWHLLGWVVGDGRMRVVLFAFCFLMLQSGTYWGEQNLAYHQTLPLLSLLGATCLMAFTRGALGWRWLAIFALGSIAGLSYVSGAISAFVLGAGWLLLAWMLRRHAVRALAARLQSGGVALLLAGTATSALQIYLTRRTQPQGRNQQYMELTWPTTSDFWAYLAGKLGRSTGHGFGLTALEVVWVAGVALALVTAVRFVLRGMLAHERVGSARWRRLAVVFLPLLGVVLVYLAMVGMGRAGLRDASVQGAEAVFRFGYHRFHFFWVTLLFPWLAAALALGLRRSAVPVGAMLGVLALTCVLAGVRGVFDVPSFYRSASAYRETEIRCLSRQLGSGEPISCPGFSLMWLPDLTRAYVYARDIRASFVRYLPIVEREGFGQDVLHWGDPQAGLRAPWVHARPLPDGWMQAEDDALVVLPLADQDLLRNCRVLGVQVGLDADQPEVAQVFYRLLGQAGYAEQLSVRKPYRSGAHGPARLEFTIDSPSGFEPELRIDPVEGHTRFRLTDLRVTCRLIAQP
ncbi:hypothetical protein [Ottowia sp.]|uniref:hypothetical protein n=1 Tax=Ottowia sp. TaxID=1898956 RepID=UPI0039E6A894